MSYDRVCTYDATYSRRVSQIRGQAYAWSYEQSQICANKCLDSDDQMRILRLFSFISEIDILTKRVTVYSEMVQLFPLLHTR